MALKNLNKENNEKLALKREGHSLVDRIKWRGYSKTTVYMLLAKEMGVEEKHAHFSSMNTLRELRKAVEALRLIEKKTPKTDKASPTRASIPMAPGIKIWRVKDQKPIKIKVEPLQLTKKEIKKAQKKANTLPQSAYMETLRQVAEDNAKRSIVKPVILTHPVEIDRTPHVNWAYKLFKKMRWQ